MSQKIPSHAEQFWVLPSLTISHVGASKGLHLTHCSRSKGLSLQIPLSVLRESLGKCYLQQLHTPSNPDCREDYTHDMSVQTFHPTWALQTLHLHSETFQAHTLNSPSTVSLSLWLDILCALCLYLIHAFVIFYFLTDANFNKPKAISGLLALSPVRNCTQSKTSRENTGGINKCLKK